MYPILFWIEIHKHGDRLPGKEDGLWVCSSGDQMRIAGPDNAQFTYSEAYYRFTILI